MNEWMSIRDDDDEQDEGKYIERKRDPKESKHITHNIQTKIVS